MNSSVLSDLDVLQEMDRGNVVIYPFDRKNLKNCSYDVTLGSYFYRSNGDIKTMNPWCESDVRKYWGDPTFCASSITLEPGETVLAHTTEFVGGLNHVTTMMKARSSLGRSCIGVCKCAGWGDIGYVNRWTMEITNFSTTTAIELPIGARVAQIVFLYSGKPSAEYSGKYQASRNVTEYWTPESMLPKLWLD